MNSFTSSYSFADFGRSESNTFGAAASHNKSGVYGSTTRKSGKPAPNFFRSQLVRPHTPSVCNRDNDTEEEKLEADSARFFEPRADGPRPLLWAKQSRRFVAKPPSARAERVAPVCDIGCEDYVQDRPAPSPRRKDVSSFAAVGRDSHIQHSARKDLDVEEEMMRLQRFCERREELRSRAHAEKVFVEAAVMYDERERPQLTPRASFREFEQSIQRAQTTVEPATTTAPPRDEQEHDNDGAAADRHRPEDGGHADDHDDDDLFHEDPAMMMMMAAGSAAAATGVYKEDEDAASSLPRNFDASSGGGGGGGGGGGRPLATGQRSSQIRTTAASHIPRAPLVSDRSESHERRDGIYGAVRRLRETKERLENKNVSKTAQRIRDQHTSAAADRTSYRYPTGTRSQAVRMVDPDLATSGIMSNSDDFMNGGGGDTAFDENNPSSGSSDAAAMMAGGVGGKFKHGKVGRAAKSYCRVGFYDVPVEAFRHVSTPRLAPRENASLVLHKKTSQSLAAAGKYAADDEREEGQKDRDQAGKRNTSPAAGSTTPRGTNNKSTAAAGAISPQRMMQLWREGRYPGAGIGGSNQKNNNPDDGKPFQFTRLRHTHNFDYQTSRERRPLSAGAQSHLGFSVGLTNEGLFRSEVATGVRKDTPTMTMKLPLHEKKPPAQQLLQSFPKYTLVHNQSPRVVMGKPPLPRPPHVLGSPEGKGVPEVVTPSHRTWGQLSTTPTIDCRDPLENLRRGIDMTHPKAIWDIKIQPLKKVVNDDDDEVAL